MGRLYFTLALTTTGDVGPPETVEWFDRAFAVSASAELAALGTSSAACHRRHMFWAAVQAALYRSTASMVFRDHGTD